MIELMRRNRIGNICFAVIFRLINLVLGVHGYFSGSAVKEIHEIICSELIPQRRFKIYYSITRKWYAT